ncbi:SAM-dependent methyltransferase [Microvirga sp. W0021]|uniref:SAM-dependent methyltransferase n=1 Tax=Hohaiivirga grylli TaxID=3133970 RepID=A0ABV0BM33_9HYPH
MKSFSDQIRDLIILNGPISVERYMGLCLEHYYASRDPLGAAGDFTTAPEISQIFGELIGLWFAEIWSLMGAPQRVLWVELGPGRGTLTADALRASQLVPAFHEALEVHLVETSPVLREKQQQTLGTSQKKVVWHETLESLPDDAPILIVANEFFDALPVQQYVTDGGQWRQRCIGLAEDNHSFRFGLFKSEQINMPLKPEEGQLLEYPAASISYMTDLSLRLKKQSGTALLIDYGYAAPAYGDSLQALYRHQFVDVLERAGEADLTTHVCFQYLASVARHAGLSVHGLARQGEFLRQLGIEVRASMLAKAAPDEADNIYRAVERLIETDSQNMGELFKILAVSSLTNEELPGIAINQNGILTIV